MGAARSYGAAWNMFHVSLIFSLFFFSPFCIIEKPQNTNPRVVSSMKILRAVDAETTHAPAQSSQAKIYSRMKLTLSLVGTIFSFAIMAAVIVTGFSLRVENFVHSYTDRRMLRFSFLAHCSERSAESSLSRSVFTRVMSSSIVIICRTKISFSGSGNREKDSSSASLSRSR